ncbi:hypothetical protein LB410_17700 [Escherichia coli]|uniref:hypothetical protein n=2 Tax=Escherichia coli TaxID=562 RepID=UPI000C7FDEF7|nr:hypothetical protein [Escherichia coli]MBS9573884.1 hypothetical protein [Escherichia coli]MBS9614673.1 hypothetical protein [Escherichia coli]MCG2943170.1 hypothetical protein [Escherichia coli]MDF6898878.1 hypothetical protein [Escherichia coli]MTF29105.1 hypothetical protein [Escherichia coli]
MNEVQQLLQQVRILEQEAANKTGAERQALQKAAAKVKMQIIKLLPQRGQQQQQESKIPDPNDYFGSKLPEGFENYFSGDYLTQEMESYFDNLTPEQRDYFTVQVPDNAPDAPKKEPDKTKVFDDWEYRRKVFNALGIPC